MLFQRKIVPYSYASVNEHMQRWSTSGIEFLLIMMGKRKTSLTTNSSKTKENSLQAGGYA